MKMMRKSERTAIRGAFVATAALLGVAASAGAQPAISAVAGSYAQNAAVTITGSGFGTKPVAAPVVWDDSSGTLLSKWTGGWPNCSTNATYNIAPRAPIRGINPPHARVGKYYAGAHAEENGYCGGWDVMLFKSFSGVTTPVNIYASWYQRADDNWVFGLGSPADDNYKVIDWTTDATPYGQTDVYGTYNPSPTSTTSIPVWAFSPGMGRTTTDWGGNATNPMGGTWTKVEAILRWSAGTDGRLQVVDNGNLQIDYTGITDNAPSGTRTFGIGGYARSRDVNNWRYFTDLYLDTTWARVMLGNASTLTASTKREMQIPSAWSNTSITITANLAAFSEGQTAYLYVFDSTGRSNANGYPVALGTSTSRPPAPPTNVRIIK